MKREAEKKGSLRDGEKMENLRERTMEYSRETEIEESLGGAGKLKVLEEIQMVIEQKDNGSRIFAYVDSRPSAPRYSSVCLLPSSPDVPGSGLLSLKEFGLYT